MSIDWGAVWVWLWPILKEAAIALLVALLAILGYDKAVSSRYTRAVQRGTSPPAPLLERGEGRKRGEKGGGA